MAKPALGRSLGNLLGETPIAGKPDEPAAAPPESVQPELSSGVSALLSAGKTPDVAAPKLAAANPAPAAPAKPAATSIFPPKGPQSEPIWDLFSKTRGGGQPELRLRKFNDRQQTITWILFGADALLVILAVVFVWVAPKPLEFWQTVLCVVLVALGAVLGVLAMLRKRAGS